MTNSERISKHSYIISIMLVFPIRFPERKSELKNPPFDNGFLSKKTAESDKKDYSKTISEDRFQNLVFVGGIFPFQHNFRYEDTHFVEK